MTIARSVARAVASPVAKAVTGGIGTGGGPSYDADAQTYFTAVEGAGGSFDLSGINATYTDSYVKQAHSDLFAGLKADGLWSKITELYWFVGKTFGGLTVKAKGSGAIINNGFIAGDHLAAGSGTGLTGDGSSYLTLGNPSSSLGSLFAVIVSPPSANGSYIGVKAFPSTDRLRLGYDLVANFDFANIGGENTDRVTGGTAEARIVVVSRQSATSLKFFDNGVQIAEVTNSITFLDSDDPLPLLGFAEHNNSDLPSNFSNATITALGYGAALTNADAAALSTRLNSFMSALGNALFGIGMSAIGSGFLVG